MNGLPTKSFFLSLVVVLMILSCSRHAQYKEVALQKIDTLALLMEEARADSIDVSREETLIWFSREFIKFADWDEAHQPEIEKLYGYYEPFEEEKDKHAKELPNFVRQKVIEILDVGIENLKKVMSGIIKRRPVSKVDWENIELGENMLLSNGKPIFLHDYFSKTVGASLTDTNVYNQHLGSIFHGGSTLYEVDQDRAINPFLLKKDRTFDEEKLRLITEIPDKSIGFMLLWNSGMPEWIVQEEPEVEKSRSLFTGFDVDNPLMQEVWGEILQKTGELTRGKRVSRLGYILSNEPHWFSEEGNWRHQYKEMNSLSTYTLNKFRNWLPEKYDQDIGALNENWQSDFDSFETVKIEIPIDTLKRGMPIWYDWCRFNMDRGIEWFSFLQEELRTTNPEAQTHIKIMPKVLTEHERSHGIDIETLTELTSMIGDDAKTKAVRDRNRDHPEPWETKYAYYWDELGFSYDFFESVAPNKIHINSEAHFLSTYWFRDQNTSPDYVRSCYWLATLHGMDVGISWFWARDPDGSPEDRLEGDLDFFDPALAGSYAASVNMQPQTANAVAQVYLDMNAYAEEIIALRQQRRPIRLFYSETAAINKKLHMQEQLEMYESLYFEGFPVGFATEKIINKQDNKDWDIIIVYKTEFVTDTEFATLQRYLDEGGTILIDNNGSLVKNEYGQLRNQSLQAGNGKILIMSDLASPAEIRNKALELLPTPAPLMLTEENGSPYKGCTWRLVENPQGGYLVNILNLGKNTAMLQFNTQEGKTVNCKDLLTGQMLDSEFELKPKGVLLLEVKQIN